MTPRCALCDGDRWIVDHKAGDRFYTRAPCPQCCAPGGEERVPGWLTRADGTIEDVFVLVEVGATGDVYRLDEICDLDGVPISMVAGDSVSFTRTSSI